MAIEVFGCGGEDEEVKQGYTDVGEEALHEEELPDRVAEPRRGESQGT